MIHIDPNRFVVVGDQLIRLSQVTRIGFSEVEDLRIEITYLDGNYEKKQLVEGIQAIDLLMDIRASVLENKRLRWKRHVWAVHNLIGHPLMQVLAFFKAYKAAMFVHDITVPRPLGTRNS